MRNKKKIEIVDIDPSDKCHDCGEEECEELFTLSNGRRFYVRGCDPTTVEKIEKILGVDENYED